MRQATLELIAHLLNNNTFLLADLFEFRLPSGTVLCYSGCDRDLVFNDHIFSSTGPIIHRSRTRLMVGVEVDTLELEVAPGDDLLVGLPWIQAAGAGALDGSEIALYRAFLDQTDLSVIGVVKLFVGQVADLQTSRNLVKITANSHAQLLNTKMPRNLWQSGCLLTLYDADCGAVRNGNATTASIGSTVAQINCGLAQAAGWYDQGYVEFISGALTGEKRTIKSYQPGILHLLLPLPAPPSVGDGLKAYPGCDKKQSTCTTKFNNVSHFRGFPYIPVAETAI